MQKLILLITAILLAPLSICAQTPNKEKEHKQHINSYRISYDVNSDGTFTAVTDSTIYLDTADSVRSHGEIPLPPYSSSLQSLEVLAAYTIKPDDSRVAVPPEGIQTQAAPVTAEAPLFSDYMITTLIFPELTPGCAINYKTKLVQKKPVFNGQFSIIERYDFTRLFWNYEITVTAPLNYPLYADVANLEGGRLPDAQGRARWSWRSKLSPWDSEPDRSQPPSPEPYPYKESPGQGQTGPVSSADSGQTRSRTPPQPKPANRKDKSKAASEDRENLKRTLEIIEAERASEDSMKRLFQPQYAAITSFPNFQALGDAYWSESKDKIEVTPDIKRIADQATKSLSDKRQQAAALYDWVVNNIRYVAVELGRGGYIPHNSGGILANRYGDCKDYAVILCSLLAAKGIESFPVLINSGESDWLPKVAAPEAFNHAIVWIPSLQLYLDSSAGYAPFGVLPLGDRARMALLAGTESKLIAMPRGDPEANAISTLIEMTVQPDGSVEGKSSAELSGYAEVLWRMILDKSASSRVVSQLLAQYRQTGTGSMETVHPRVISRPLHVNVQFTLEDAVAIPGPASCRIPVGFSLAPMESLSVISRMNEIQRPLLFGALKVVERYTLTFPKDIHIDTAPKSTEFENEVGRFKSAYAVKGQSVTVERTFVCLTDFVSPEAYPALKTLLAAATKDARAQILYH
jgi:hypothetical protein